MRQGDLVELEVVDLRLYRCCMSTEERYIYSDVRESGMRFVVWARAARAQRSRTRTRSGARRRPGRGQAGQPSGPLVRPVCPLDRRHFLTRGRARLGSRESRASGAGRIGSPSERGGG